MSSQVLLPCIAMLRTLRARGLPARRNRRKNFAGLLASAAIVLVGVTGCGSTHAPSGSGVLSGEVTWASAHGSALVRVFTSVGRMIEHVGVSTSQPKFHFKLAPGQYQMLIKLTRGVLVKPGDSGCAAALVQVQVNRTTHAVLGETCRTTTS